MSQLESLFYCRRNTNVLKDVTAIYSFIVSYLAPGFWLKKEASRYEGVICGAVGYVLQFKGIGNCKLIYLNCSNLALSYSNFKKRI